jgi:hypothetical protein
MQASRIILSLTDKMITGGTRKSPTAFLARSTARTASVIMVKMNALVCLEVQRISAEVTPVILMPPQLRNNFFPIASTVTPFK